MRPRDELDERSRRSSGGSIGEILDGLEGSGGCRPGVAGRLDRRGTGSGGGEGLGPWAVTLVGLAVQDTSDALVLRMLGQLLAPSGCTLEIVTDTESPLQVAERVAEQSPRLVVVSHLPPEGLTVGPLPGPAAACSFRRDPGRAWSLGRDRQGRALGRQGGGERGNARGRRRSRRRGTASSACSRPPRFRMSSPRRSPPDAGA